MLGSYLGCGWWMGEGCSAEHSHMYRPLHIFRMYNNLIKY